MPKKPKFQPVTVTLCEDDLANIAQVRERDGTVSRSEIVRQALRHFVADRAREIVGDGRR
jgi:metal-responsive CopG/Arc/MetJ family transcriptional regulator